MKHVRKIWTRHTCGCYIQYFRSFLVSQISSLSMQDLKRSCTHSSYNSKIQVAASPYYSMSLYHANFHHANKMIRNFLMQSDLSGIFQFYQINVCIVLFAFIVIIYQNNIRRECSIPFVLYNLTAN